MVAKAAVVSTTTDAWVAWMWPMFWQVSVLAGVVWFVSRMLRQSSAMLRYALWLLVFVKLVLPPDLGLPFSAITAVSRLIPQQQSFPGQASEVPSSVLLLGSAPEAQQVAASLPEKQSLDPVAPTATVSGARYWRPAEMLLVVWLNMTIGLIGVMLIQYRRYRLNLSNGLEDAPPEIVAIAEKLADQLKLRRRYVIKISSSLSIPAVFGTFRAQILLPTECIRNLSTRELSDVLGHELAHVKRWDVLVGWCASLLVCFYWFHPMVWVAYLHLRREREMACDDAVLHATRKEGARYASTIVRLAEAFEGAPAGAGFLGLIELSDNLLHRVRSAADTTRPRQASWLSLALVAALALFLLPMTPWSPAPQAQAATTANVDDEIAAHYAKADQEVREFVRWTSEFFVGQGAWLPENAYDGLTPEQREEKVTTAVGVLEGQYDRSQIPALVDAGVLKDKRLFPGVLKAATFMNEGGQDNRTKWVAIAALGRMGDIAAVPSLIPLVDHYNKNARLWAQASLVRLTDQNFGKDKAAWVKWWNESGKGAPIEQVTLDLASAQSEKRMTALTGESPVSEANMGEWDTAVNAEIDKHYTAASAEVQEYIRWTARTFGRGRLWLPENAFDTLSAEDREAKVVYCEGVLNGEYGRHQCEALVVAGVLKDKRLMAGVAKAAAFHRDDANYDCRPKWIAVEALGRFDDISAAPTLIPLVDHGNQNVKMWARASLARLTGQNFNDDKQAWGKWWNESGNGPQIDLAQLKPWVPVSEKPASSEVQALFDKAEELFKAALYDDAMAAYRGVYENQPRSNLAATAMMMVGICHDRLEQPEEALKALEAAVKAYPDLKGYSESTYFYLGSAYLKADRKDDAIGALKKCLELGQGTREPGAFPMRQARELLAAQGVDVAVPSTKSINAPAAAP